MNKIIKEDAGYNFDTGEDATQSQFSNEDWHAYYDVLGDITEYDILWGYYGDNDKDLNWELIDPNMYQKALSEFTKFGKLIHFPEKYIYQWMGMMMRDTAKLRRCTTLSGHDNYFPSDEIYDFFYNHEEILEKYKDVYEIDYDYMDQYDFEEWSEFFDATGFYDWMLLPDGSDALSDFGIEPLERIISTYNENLPPEKVLVIINKMLDIAHCRGDLASMFIVGGRETLSQISEEVENTKKVIISESQLLLLKEYYQQTVFNFDKNGDAYFKKDNWQLFVDYLESIGKYGQLPKSEWNGININKVIERAEDYVIHKAEDGSTDEETDQYAVYRYLEDLLEDRENIDFYDYFSDDVVVDNFRRFDEWLSENRDDRFAHNDYLDEREIMDFLESQIGVTDYDEFRDYLLPGAQEELDGYRNSIFIDHRLDHDFPDSLVINERGLIYVERMITIPKYDTPNFDPMNYRDSYQYMKEIYEGIGNCWSWKEDSGEAYCGEGYGVGSTDLTLKGWVDPKNINWEESLYRNCYDLRHECEIYIDRKMPVEIERAEIDGKNILTKPLIVYT